MNSPPVHGPADSLCDGDRYVTVRRLWRRPEMEVCAVAGPVDPEMAALLRTALRDTERRQVPRVLVDLSEAGSLSPVGARVLGTAAAQARATGRQLAFLAGWGAVRRALEAGAAGNRPVIYGSLAEAVTAASIGNDRR